MRLKFKENIIIIDFDNNYFYNWSDLKFALENFIDDRIQLNNTRFELQIGAELPTIKLELQILTLKDFSNPLYDCKNVYIAFFNINKRT
jgi:hypothetical protein